MPDWFLNRRRDFRDGKTGQIVSSGVDSKLREDFERLKKIRYVTCLRGYMSPFLPALRIQYFRINDSHDTSVCAAWELQLYHCVFELVLAMYWLGMVQVC